ncbi:polyketide cyclase like protein [Fusarium pseudocircinatum]|uniref:Polyketide cyclase like protein n=1 Tax=Fusarium pseudocircinatum TaxID=56676 RepID=A0A8H5PBU0_9HYPO|nr:polyketide cyclase like protein [Fusarium pseudocircinatum]
MAAYDLAATFQAFLDAVNSKNWDQVEEHISPTVTATYGEKQESRDELVSRFIVSAKEGDQLSADTWTVDQATQSVATRLITSIKNTLEAEGTPSRVWDLVLVFFEEGRISRFYQIASQVSRDPQFGPWAPEVTSEPSKNPLSISQIDEEYRKYLYSFNDGTMPGVVLQGWAKEVSVLGNKVPREAVPNLFSKVIVPVIAGLKCEVEEMVIDVRKQQIAVRLAIEGVPENKNLQKDGEGKKVKVYEHAMYGFEEGKIAWVWAAQAYNSTPPSGW